MQGDGREEGEKAGEGNGRRVRMRIGRVRRDRTGKRRRVRRIGHCRLASAGERKVVATAPTGTVGKAGKKCYLKNSSVNLKILLLLPGFCMTSNCLFAADKEHGLI